MTENGQDAGNRRPAKSSVALEYGDSIQVRIEKGVFRGLGLARHEGRVIFVPGAYPGEKWLVRIAEIAKDYARGERLTAIETSRDRRDSPCPAFPTCGGCAYLDLTYEAQLDLKSQVLADCLTRASIEWSRPVKVTPSHERAWRTRVQLHVEREGSDLRIGFLEAQSHRVVSLPACLQLSDATNAVLARLGEELASFGELAEGTQSIELAEAHEGDLRIAMLCGKYRTARRRDLRRLRAKVPGLEALGLLSEQRAPMRATWEGKPYVVTNVHGYSFRVHARSFFQANRFMTEKLVLAVTQRIPACDTVWDLYSGVGLFALPIASRVGAVVGVEGSPFAAEDARVNAAAARLGNLEFINGDVAKTVARLPMHGKVAVVIDPPRGGATRGLVSALARRNPATIVYVSCDPPTFARDLAHFKRAGYALRSLDAFDMFPGTFHIESVASLSR